MILDLFCGAGGASKGYSLSGFDVVGVDTNDQPRYPFEFIKADVFEYLKEADLSKYQMIHASPPCQAYSDLQKQNKRIYPDYIESLRERLIDTGLLYVIENVETAPLINTITLCGTMFPTLRVIRHRLFESNFYIKQPEHIKKHPLVYTRDKRKRQYNKLNEYESYVMVNGGGNCSVDNAKDAMGIDWMIKRELNEAVPPVYTEYISKYIT